MGTAVPFAGATMTGFGGAAATSGASLFAASAAAPIASAIATPAIFTTPAALGGSLPSAGFSLSSFFSNPFGTTGLLKDISLMDVGFGVSQIGSTLQTIRQGRIQNALYELQANQRINDMELKKLNFELDGLERLRKLKRIQAANLAKAYGGGVQFDGSAALMEIVSNKEYGEDYRMDLFNLRNDIYAGNAQVAIDKTAAKDAVTGSYLDAAAKLGEGAFLYSRLGGPTA